MFINTQDVHGCLSCRFAEIKWWKTINNLHFFSVVSCLSACWYETCHLGCSIMMTNACFVLGFFTSLRTKTRHNSISYAFTLKMLKENWDTVHVVGYIRCPVFVGFCLAVSTKATIEERRKLVLLGNKKTHTLSHIHTSLKPGGDLSTHTHTQTGACDTVVGISCQISQRSSVSGNLCCLLKIDALWTCACVCVCVCVFN